MPDFFGPVNFATAERRCAMSEDTQTGVSERNSFAFYWSFKDAIRDMSDVDKLAIYEAITNFAFFGIEPDGLAPVGRLAWKLIRPQLEASIRRYDTCVSNGAKGKEFGKLGGRPRKNKPPGDNPKEKPQTETPTHNPLNHNQNHNHNQNRESIGDCKGESDKPIPVATKRRAFVAPSPEDVKAYFSTIKGAHTDAESFFDHFTSNGWKVSGKAPMKDWKSAARQWMRRKSEFNNTQTMTSYETNPIYQEFR